MKTLQITKAAEIARKYHKGSFRTSGEGNKIDYFKHCEGVAEMVSKITDDPEMICAAYLHDTIEDIEKADKKLSLESLTKEISSLGINVLRYVEALSHDKNKEDYQAYIERIASDKKLRIIKVCDMIWNVTESPSDRQREKYRNSLFTLFSALIKK